MTESSDQQFRYEVAFSFAGPHRKRFRELAVEVSNALDPGLQDRSLGRVFFDEWFEHELLGKDMDRALERVYLEESRMIVVDASEAYEERPWCQSEARAINALGFGIDSARDEVGRLRILDVQLHESLGRRIVATTGRLIGLNRSIEECAGVVLKRHALLKKRMDPSQEPPAAPVVAPPQRRQVSALQLLIVAAIAVALGWGIWSLIFPVESLPGIVPVATRFTDYFDGQEPDARWDGSGPAVRIVDDPSAVRGRALRVTGKDSRLKTSLAQGFLPSQISFRVKPKYAGLNDGVFAVTAGQPRRELVRTYFSHYGDFRVASGSFPEYQQHVSDYDTWHAVRLTFDWDRSSMSVELDGHIVDQSIPLETFGEEAGLGIELFNDDNSDSWWTELRVGLPATRWLYWAAGAGSGSGVIYRAQLADLGQRQTLVRGLDRPMNLAATRSGLFWTEEDRGAIYRSDLEGGDPTPIVEGRDRPRGIVIEPSSGELIWSEFGAGAGGLFRARQDGTGVRPLLPDAKTGFGSLAIDADGTNLFIGQCITGEILRAPLPTGLPDFLSSSTMSGPFQLSLDPHSGDLLYADVNRDGIWVVGNGGRELKALVQFNDDFANPAAVVVDERDRRIYFSWSGELEAGSGNRGWFIDSCDLNGGDRRTEASQIPSSPNRPRPSEPSINGFLLVEADD